MELRVYLNKAFSSQLSLSYDKVKSTFKNSVLFRSDDYTDIVREFVFEDSDIDTQTLMTSYLNSDPMSEGASDLKYFDWFNKIFPFGGEFENFIKFEKFDVERIAESNELSICLFEPQDDIGNSVLPVHDVDQVELNTGLLCCGFNEFEDPLNWEDVQNSTDFKNEVECFKYFKGCSRQVLILEKWALYNMSVEYNYDKKQKLFSLKWFKNSLDFIYRNYFSKLPKHRSIKLVLSGSNATRFHSPNVKHSELFFLDSADFDTFRRISVPEEKIIYLKERLREFVNKILDLVITKLNSEGHQNIDVTIIFTCEALMTIYDQNRSGFYLSDEVKTFFDRLHNGKKNRCINTNRNVLQYDKSPTDLAMGDPDMPYLYGDIRRVSENLGRSYACKNEYLKILDNYDLADYCVAKYPDDQSSVPQTP